MAIIKDIELPSGTICSYHKIGSLHINWHENYGRIDVISFISKDTRLDGKIFARELRIDVLPENFPFVASQNVVADAYTFIKTLPDFEGAVDDI